MIPHEQLHLVYIIICVLLLISSIYHIQLYQRLPSSCDKLSDKKDYDFYMNKARDGVIRGILFGIILNGELTTAIRNGAIYGTLNPLLSFMGMS